LKFVVDGMLGSLARKLRVLGFDVIYDADISDEEALEVARREGRIVVTSDRALSSSASRKSLDNILLTERDDEERLLTIFRRLGVVVHHPDPAEARCPICNGEVEEAGRGGVEGRVPESVIERYDEFYICRSCGKVYWVGSHWRRMLELFKRVELRLQQT